MEESSFEVDEEQLEENEVVIDDNDGYESDELNATL